MKPNGSFHFFSPMKKALGDRTCLGEESSNLVNRASLGRFAGVLVAVATLSACTGGSPLGPASAAIDSGYVGKMLQINGRLVTAERAPSAMPTFATLVRARARIGKDFEYIDNIYGSYASIFDYPKSTAQIGGINGVGGQACTNVLYGYGRKTFWIVESDKEINEYAAPKKPLKSLSDSVGMPSSCAMNLSGDLAVGILNGPGTGDVVVYAGAHGKGTAMKTPLSAEYFDGYDAAGNLFADGFTHSGRVALVGLLKGTSKFQIIATSNGIGFPGSVQWDGRSLTVFDQHANALYEYTVKGTKALLKHTVRLAGSSDCAQTWIVKGLIYCADAGTNGAEVFNYPAGGSPAAVFSGDFDVPLGTTAAKN
jgi:hypothetical protein